MGKAFLGTHFEKSSTSPHCFPENNSDDSSSNSNERDHHDLVSCVSVAMILFCAGFLGDFSASSPDLSTLIPSLSSGQLQSVPHAWGSSLLSSKPLPGPGPLGCSPLPHLVPDKNKGGSERGSDMAQCVW